MEGLSLFVGILIGIVLGGTGGAVLWILHQRYTVNRLEKHGEFLFDQYGQPFGHSNTVSERDAERAVPAT